jgi:hypothetical protein
MQFYYRCLHTNNKYMFVHVRSYATQYLIHAICFLLKYWYQARVVSGHVFVPYWVFISSFSTILIFDWWIVHSMGFFSSFYCYQYKLVQNDVQSLSSNLVIKYRDLFLKYIICWRNIHPSIKWIQDKHAFHC